MCRLNSFTEEWKEDIIIFKVNVFNVCVTSVYLLEQNGKPLMFILNVFIHQETNKLRFHKNERGILLFIIL